MLPPISSSLANYKSQNIHLHYTATVITRPTTSSANLLQLQLLENRMIYQGRTALKRAGLSFPCTGQTQAKPRFGSVCPPYFLGLLNCFHYKENKTKRTTFLSSLFSFGISKAHAHFQHFLQYSLLRHALQY